MQLSDSSTEKSPTRISDEDKSSFDNGSKVHLSANIARNDENIEELISIPINSPKPGLQELPIPDPDDQAAHYPNNNNAPATFGVEEIATTKSLKDLEKSISAGEEALITSEISAEIIPEDKPTKHSEDKAEEASVTASKSSDITDAKEITPEINEHVPDTISANTFSANTPNSSISVADDLATRLRTSKEPESVPVVGTRQKCNHYANAL